MEKKQVSQMKAVILCGGQGTRIRDISEVLPKPMLPIGGKPVLWHIMKTYAGYGIKDFVLCLGYKGWLIKEFFLNYCAKMSDVTVTLARNAEVEYHNPVDEEDWKVTLAETGESSQTGARVWNARRYLQDADRFCLTYGDGVADINLEKLLKTHQGSGRLATVTGVHPSGRFGEMEIDGTSVTEFDEKPNVSTGLINGGFMVFERRALDKYFRPGDDLILESEVLHRMVADRQLAVYKHDGSWQCVDTPREYGILNRMWEEGKAFWKTW